MIPKVIHYCWFGGNPLPKDAQMCLASWKKYLPDYEIKVWNESNFDVNCCPYVKGAYEQKKFAFVSDYARFWVLYNEGGVYFDTDVEVIKNMNHIISAGNFMGIEKSHATQNPESGEMVGVNAGLGMGCEPNSSFLKEMLDLYESKPSFTFDEGTIVHHTTWTLQKYGFLNENKFQDVAGFKIYPADFFCPMDSTTGLTDLTENTVSIHHYSCSWVNQKTLSFQLHLLKNKLIKLLGPKVVLKLASLFSRSK